ncbi:MAG TPA: cell division protein FtsZ [Dehalococcoidales bacterium]|nr:cell division protein FtsZ [Dehalococcoidales bacterium]
MARTSFSASPVRIKVVGLGGGGSNAITRMVRDGVDGVEFICMNTDAQSLAIAEAPVRIQLGEKLVRGLGAGGDHHVGQKAAEENRDEIKEVLAGADMIFITAGMGGGTGTGSSSVVAEIAKQSGALTIAVVTKPFGFEGTHRMKVADEGVAALVDKVDTLVIIPNDRLLALVDQKTGVDAAFRLADEVLCNGVASIAQVITTPGLINLDFADIRSIMKDAGPAWMSIGRGSGQNRAVDAAKNALASPLLDVAMNGAKGVLFNIIGGDSLSLFEVNEAAEVIKAAVDPDANIIFGVVHDSRLDKDVKMTLVATGFEANPMGGSGAMRPEVAAEYLKDLKNEEQLDIPAFLRRANATQHHAPAPVPQAAAAKTAQSNRPTSYSPSWR